MSVLRWLRSLLLHRRLERDMREEMRQHLERATERLMARGLPYEEARRAAPLLAVDPDTVLTPPIGP